MHVKDVLCLFLLSGCRFHSIFHFFFPEMFPEKSSGRDYPSFPPQGDWLLNHPDVFKPPALAWAGGGMLQPPPAWPPQAEENPAR